MHATCLSSVNTFVPSVKMNNVEFLDLLVALISTKHNGILVFPSLIPHPYLFSTLINWYI